MHPPLARVAVALGPFLAGIRWNPQLGMWAGGNAILAARNQYLHNLALARAGVLPFFVICAFLTWFWAATRYGATAAGAAALFFTTCPVILGHAGLATTDMAAAAGFMGALLAFIIGSRAPQIPDPPSSAPPPPWACFANSAFPFSCSGREPVCGLAGAARARRAFRRAFFPMGPGLSRNPSGRDPGALGRIPVHLWLPSPSTPNGPIKRLTD